MKNIIIVLLTIICVSLGFVLLNKVKKDGLQSTATMSVSAPTTVVAKKGALDRSGMINLAEIDGLSLSTKPNKISEFLKKIGYECKKINSSWQCLHNTLENTKILVHTKGENVMHISRNGRIDPASIPGILDYLETLRSKLNTRKEVTFSQSDDRTIFIVKDRTEKEFLQLSYQVQLQTIPNEDGETQEISVYNASISKK